MLYLLFFASGASALIYEVVWVRVFANVFGNTIYSASIVTAVFMLGLGSGSLVAGMWADRRPNSLIHVFASLEFAIGAPGLGFPTLLPVLGELSAAVSSYTRGTDGWYVLSFGSYAARTLIALVLLTPITLLMGGTLTVLIRHLLRGADLSTRRIAWLYGVNTLGAALGCFLTDFSLVPSFGLHATQLIAVALNLAPASGGLASVNARTISDAAGAYTTPTAFDDFWFNARPILLVVSLPALLMGFAFPIANAIIQRAEATVGRRAGLLYLANTFGAVCGSIVTGFVLLPMLGMQRSATVLMIAAAFAIAPLVRLKADATVPVVSGFSRTAAIVIPIVAIVVWLLLPSDYLLSRALLFPPQRAYTISEGVTELVAVTDGPDGGRVLVTNGHPMSSTELLSNRYMRAMGHVPLLLADNPERVLVLCFGVGNTANAATLHPTVTRVEVVDLSRHILEHADYFKDFNGDVLHDPRVAVYITDGRHHLQMRSSEAYDLITLEPPPIVHAGVAALYTTEFYQRARARLKPNGYLTQWLPAYGVPQSRILSMPRSFVDVVPNP